MAGSTKIEWTEKTWNPITGCTKISDGCKNCYAERMAHRLHLMGSNRYTNRFKVTIHRDLFHKPLSWKKPRMIFVNSMSDMFHEDISDEVILELFDVMRKASWHTFQILTKRSKRLIKLSTLIEWPKNVWMGVSVEDMNNFYRVRDLLQTDAKVKFISFEPLLGLIDSVSINGIDWAIVGGESGPNSRFVDPEWVRAIKRLCEKDGTSFFFKQWGGKNKKKSGRLLDGKEYIEYPLKKHE